MTNHVHSTNRVTTNQLQCQSGLFYIINNFLWKDIPSIFTNAFSKFYGGKCEHYPNRKGCIAVVTGGEKYYEICLIRELANIGYTVVVGVKNPITSDTLLEMIKNETFSGSIVLLQLNLDSLKSIAQFAREINMKYKEVSLVVNNFDYFCQEYATTKDGFESNIGVNYFAHFYLTHLLLESLKTTAYNKPFYSRFVTVTSPEFFGSRLNFTDMNNNVGYSYRTSYGQAKLALLMMTKYLDDRMETQQVPVKFYAVNSGALYISEMNWIMKNPLLKWLISFVQINPSKNVNSILYSCLSKSLELNGGRYISNCRDAFTSPYSRNKDYQEKLFQFTCKLLKIEDFGSRSGPSNSQDM